MSKVGLRFSVITLSILALLCSAACIGCSSAAELSASLKAETAGLDDEYHAGQHCTKVG